MRYSGTWLRARHHPRHCVLRLIGAMLMGTTSQRYLLRMPDLVDVDTEYLLQLITPALRAVIEPSA